LSPDDLFQLEARAIEIAQRLVNACNDQTKSPVHWIVTEVSCRVIESRMVAPSCETHAHQPIRDSRSVVALAASCAEILLRTQKIAALRLKESDFEELLRGNRMSLSASINASA